MAGLNRRFLDQLSCLPVLLAKKSKDDGLREKLPVTRAREHFYVCHATREILSTPLGTCRQRMSVASLSVELGRKERPRNGISVFCPREKWRESQKREREFYGSRPIFRAEKTSKIPFLGLSLLLNPTEMLATQARTHCFLNFISLPSLVALLE